jgi:cytochrome P450
MWGFAPEILPNCSEDDIIAQCRQLFQAGSQTTTHLLCNAGALLFDRPELWRRLKADRDKLDRFVEEVVRVLGVLQQRPRVATRDTVLGGQRIATGDRVYAILPAASRDPGRFPHPFTLDLEGGERRRHLTFSVGPRVCAGAAFARTEAREVIHSLLDHIDEPRLDPGQPPPAWTGLISTDWRPLHVRFAVRENGSPATAA